MGRAELATRLAAMAGLEFAVQDWKISLATVLRGDLWVKRFLIVQYI